MGILYIVAYRIIYIEQKLNFYASVLEGSMELLAVLANRNKMDLIAARSYKSILKKKTKKVTLVIKHVFEMLSTIS